MIHVTPNAEILLHNFQDYLRYKTQYFDGAFLITLVLHGISLITWPACKCFILLHVHSGINLNGGTLGVARLGTMCSGRYSSGLGQDTGSSVAFLASIAAHELGHNLNMNHDDGRKYMCWLYFLSTCLLKLEYNWWHYHCCMIIYCITCSHKVACSTIQGCTTNKNYSYVKVIFI